MKELNLKIKYDDTNGYKGHGEDTEELIKGVVDVAIEIELSHDEVISEYSVDIVDDKNSLNKDDLSVLLSLVCNDAQTQVNNGGEVTKEMYDLRYKLRDLWKEK